MILIPISCLLLNVPRLRTKEYRLKIKQPMPRIIEITITIGQGSTVSLISLLLNIYDHIEYCSGETFDKK